MRSSARSGTRVAVPGAAPLREDAPASPLPLSAWAARARGAAKGGRPSVGAGPAPAAATEPKVAQVGVVNRPAAFNPKVED